MTSFSTIYESNTLIRNTPSFRNFDEYNLSKILFGYLKQAISYFLYDCAKDLTLRTDPVFSEYIVVGDGTEKVFTLPTTPASIENIDVWIDSTRITDYVYNSVGKTLTFTTAPADGANITAQFYSCGHFTEDLDIREVHILSEGMIIPYLQKFKNDENAMKYIVSGSSLKFYSQANHINSSNNNVVNQHLNIVEGLISEYSYKRHYADYSPLVGE